MGIRAVGFLKPSEYGDDASKYLNKFREHLFQLGAFGFETWTCKIYSRKAQTDSILRLISFNDTPDQNILITKSTTLVGDANFQSVLKDIGLPFDKTLIFKIDGSMAQLGDFKVRYGVSIVKEKQVGILFDIEYLPVTKLSVNSDLIFSSVCKTMDLQAKLYTPQNSESNEYNFSCLGQNYIRILLDNDIAQ